MSRASDEALAEIDAYLADVCHTVGYDPANPGINDDSSQFLETQENETPVAGEPSALAPPAPPPPPARRPLPRVGTIVQRSDATQRRKLAFLTTPPPPLAPIRGQRGRKPAPAAATTVARKPPTGPRRVPEGQLRRPPTNPRPSTAARKMPASESARPSMEELFGPSPSPPRSPEPRPTPPVQFGPPPPPPVIVTVEPAVEVEIPYFAAHISRKYRARVGDRKYIVRFDRHGQLRSSRRQ